MWVHDPKTLHESWKILNLSHARKLLPLGSCKEKPVQTVLMRPRRAAERSSERVNRYDTCKGIIPPQPTGAPTTIAPAPPETSLPHTLPGWKHWHPQYNIWRPSDTPQRLWPKSRISWLKSHLFRTQMAPLTEVFTPIGNPGYTCAHKCLYFNGIKETARPIFILESSDQTVKLQNCMKLFGVG